LNPEFATYDGSKLATLLPLADDALNSDAMSFQPTVMDVPSMTSDWYGSAQPERTSAPAPMTAAEARIRLDVTVYLLGSAVLFVTSVATRAMIDSTLLPIPLTVKPLRIRFGNETQRG
jgi:hypothetical protein